MCVDLQFCAVWHDLWDHAAREYLAVFWLYSSGACNLCLSSAGMRNLLLATRKILARVVPSSLSGVVLVIRKSFDRARALSAPGALRPGLIMRAPAPLLFERPVQSMLSSAGMFERPVQSMPSSADSAPLRRCTFSAPFSDPMLPDDSTQVTVHPTASSDLQRCRANEMLSLPLLSALAGHPGTGDSVVPICGRLEMSVKGKG
jgi:hypothetical protein